MNINKITVLFTFIAAFSLLWWAYSRPQPEAKSTSASTRPLNNQSQAQTSSSTSTSESVVDTSNKRIAAIPADLVTEYMVNNYQTSKNYREYIDRVKLYPEKGGLYYAYSIASLCERWGNWFGKNEAIPYETEVSHAMAQKKQAALEEVRSRCNGVLPGEFNQYFKGVTTNQDPINQTSVALYSKDPQKRAYALKSYMDIADPLLIESGAMQILPVKAANPEEKNVDKIVTARYYDGQWYQGDDEKALSQAASSLLPCYFGWKCDESGLDILAMCVMSEVCAKTRFEVVRDIYFKGDEKKYQQAVAFAESMAKNIREKNIDPFIVKK